MNKLREIRRFIKRFDNWNINKLQDVQLGKDNWKRGKKFSK